MNHRDLSIMAKPLRALALAVLPLAAFACAGPPFTTPIDGEPICSDFEVGAARTKMNGGLRFPVQLLVKQGSNVVFKTTILGRRNEKELSARILLADTDEKYSVEWVQCENERAPKPVEVTGRDVKGAARYECGDKSEPYHKEELVTKKGDPKSHALSFRAPPNPACLQGTTAAAEAPDAGAPDAAAAPPESADAGADLDASAAATDGGDVGDAGADAAAADGGDAGATGDADAGKSEKGAARSQ